MHEPAPDVGGAHVFGAEEDDAGVDTDDVRVDPVGLGIKGVDEAVLAVNLWTPTFAHRVERSSGELGCEHQRTTSGGRNDRAVDVRIARWTTPGEIAFGTVGSSDAPDVWSKGGKIVREVHAKGAMRERGGDGVFKVINAVAAIFAPVAEVDPGVRVLMHEQRHADRGEVSVTFVTVTIAPQRVP